MGGGGASRHVGDGRPSEARPSDARPSDAAPSTEEADSDISAIIRRRMHELPTAERKVARAILSGAPTAGLESSTRLAQLAGASGPTVIRFANRLGYSTYAEFQRALRSEIDARVDSPISMYRRYRPESSAAARLQTAAEPLGRAVTQTLQELPAAELETAVELLAEVRRRVVATGGWFSNLLARHLVALLQEVRPRTVFVEPALSQRAALLVDAAKNDVAVVFDSRRYESDTIALARRLSAKGVKIVLVTDEWLSPIADFSAAVLSTRAVPSSPFESLAPAMAVVETLVAGVVDRLGTSVRPRLEQFTSVADAMIPSWEGSEPG